MSGVFNQKQKEETQQAGPLRVALDVRTWGMSGLGTYLRELLGGFARIGAPVEWTMIGPEDLRGELPEGLKIAQWIDFRAPLYSVPASIFYPSLGKIDLHHHPHYNLPLARVRRRVVTVFDLFHLKYGSWPKQRYLNFHLRRMRWTGALVLTACEKVKGELVERGELDARWIEVVALGAGRAPAWGAGPVAPAEVKSLTGGVLKRWVLAVGIDQPHKNFEFLISAMGLYGQRRGDAPGLVWSGLSAERAAQRARGIHAHMRPRMAFDPYSDSARLDSLYRGAMALVFPSLDEGFGLPPLEAMARGVPVICSRREPMVSILGDAALYFEPTDSASLWRMLDRFMDAPGLRDEMIRKGLQRAARYTWEETARRTYGAYLRAAGRSG